MCIRDSSVRSLCIPWVRSLCRPGQRRRAGGAPQNPKRRLCGWEKDGQRLVGGLHHHLYASRCIRGGGPLLKVEGTNGRGLPLGLFGVANRVLGFFFQLHRDADGLHALTSCGLVCLRPVPAPGHGALSEDIVSYGGILTAAPRDETVLVAGRCLSLIHISEPTRPY